MVGAGFGGLGAAIELKRLGIDDLVILERASGVGGTWHANRYPGVAVDIASATYSFSFEPNPDWTRIYAPGSELKAYAEHVADKYDLARHVQLDVEVLGAAWDDIHQRWAVELADGPTLTARYLVVATGILSQPRKPAIPGIDDFAGKVLYTSSWPESDRLTAERVAVIGTGATAVQVVPELAAHAASVAVFQRTPIWVTPKPDLPIPRPVREVFRRVPATQRAARYANAAFIEYIGLGLVAFERAPWILESLETVSKAHLRLQVRDRATREALTPDYNFFCKRPTFSNSYYKAFNHDHVDLVAAPIDHIDSCAVITEDGKRREIDTLVLATGFHLQEEGNFPAFPVRGRDGVELGARWREHGYESYEGITVNGYPNLFCLTSPFSFTGLSFFYQAESQMAHMARVITELRRRHSVTFEVKPHAQNRFVKQMDAKVEHSLWAHGDCASANSYYFNADGATRLGRLEPTVIVKWRSTHFPLADYRFETVTDPAVRQAARADAPPIPAAAKR
ncbi:NAD(P)/FAD-dependent oxidoreductase [Aeromicrobium sp. A1-2]|uniref:flavin-containing monooxygenase n=1 Tax=Aeromicrobium sp. A1-2 TaxID=2107713 RepID=UPI0013C2E215|nr:NAD(P)/FAD-dependent oxidoreductase [Aeromicrobium sp. A1-2]